MTASPNIVWLTLDSIRADHTTMGGYERDTTPHLQRIADSAHGTSFSQCIAHTNWTRASTASIVTGTYPSHHQVGGDHVIPNSLQTVPELLSDKGYNTAAISRNANSAMGFDRGFDEFTWISASTIFDVCPYRTLVKYALNIHRHSAGFTTDTAKHATPFLINDMAKRWMGGIERDPDPFFIYLHYNEPHRPYYPPKPYLDEYTDDISMSPSEAAEFALHVHENLDELVANGLDFTDDEWEALIAMYDAEIKYTDECVGRLFDYVQNLDGKTIFILTADHGEMFGERGVLAHKLLLDGALTNVPLVVHGLDEIDHQADELVQHGDLMQTLVAQAGGDTSQFQGVDLRSDRREFAISQCGPNRATLEKFSDINPDFDWSPFHAGTLTALRTSEFKLQWSDGEDSRTELFELPDEETDVSEAHPELTEELQSKLQNWLQTAGQPVGDEAEGEFSDAMRDQLEDLGYMM